MPLSGEMSHSVWRPLNSCANLEYFWRKWISPSSSSWRDQLSCWGGEGPTLALAGHRGGRSRGKNALKWTPDVFKTPFQIAGNQTPGTQSTIFNSCCPFRNFIRFHHEAVQVLHWINLGGHSNTPFIGWRLITTIIYHLTSYRWYPFT